MQHVVRVHDVDTSVRRLAHEPVSIGNCPGPWCPRVEVQQLRKDELVSARRKLADLAAVHDRDLVPELPEALNQEEGRTLRPPGAVKGVDHHGRVHHVRFSCPAAEGRAATHPSARQ